MPDTTAQSEKLPFRIHPRVFAALGSDLVTSDVVAVIELVKNSYDAFASRVDVAFRQSQKDGSFLEIMDDGLGMDRYVIEEAWCVVATPFRKMDPVSKKSGRTRAVSGEKGLGRLSTARLGESMELVTQTEGGTCWTVTLNWGDLSSATDMSDCYVACRACSEKPFEQSGTRIRLYGLKSEWTDVQLTDLQDNLSRLISPFRKGSDFAIYLTLPSGDTKREAVQIFSPDFLAHPPYAMRGHVTAGGEIRAKYEFNPLGGIGGRDSAITRNWAEVLEALDQSSRLGKDSPGCGPFSFEIRAWDIGPDDTQDIADKFKLRKAAVRQSIRSHKGLSIYRDGILVLPKSEDARDWLGLDLRRVSRVGNRLSTTQIVGYVSISAASNPKIADTSDRERLVQNREVLGFQEVLRQVVSLLEIERDLDRHKPEDEVKLEALLDGVSAGELVQELLALQEDGAEIGEAVARVKGFSERLDLVRRNLKKRFVYYSRLATVGTIAEMLVHEIRNRTTAIARFLRLVGQGISQDSQKELVKQLAAAEGAVSSLSILPIHSRRWQAAVLSVAVETRSSSRASPAALRCLNRKSSASSLRLQPGRKMRLAWRWTPVSLTSYFSICCKILFTGFPALTRGESYR